MPYLEHRPDGATPDGVDCFWTKVSPGPSAVQRVVPDGCLDMLFHLGPAPWAHVVGAMTRAEVVSGGGPQHFVAVRFRPGAARRFLGQPVEAFTDRHIPLQECSPDADQLLENLVEAPGLPEQVTTLAEWVNARSRRAPELDRTVDRAVTRLAGEAPPTIDVLVQELGVTRQHLGRLFRAHVGLSPKVLARVLRFQRWTRAVSKTQGRVDWADLASTVGYFDQAHLIHEVKELTGVTPVPFLQYRRRESVTG